MRETLDPGRNIRGISSSSPSGSGSTFIIVADINARDALDHNVYKIVKVEDASDDPTVDTDGAMYYWSDSRNAWIKSSEEESMDLLLTWNNITGKPSSSPANIDDAVTKRHQHSNLVDLENLTSNHISLLNNLSQNTLGELFYSGNKVLTEPFNLQWSTVEW